MKRCDWVKEDEPLYVTYHDIEWGVPVYDDRLLFEILTLEGAQAGLNWLTILKKREGYTELFANFQIDVVATFNEQRMNDIVKDHRIIRHKGKIKSVVNNAKCIQTIQKEFGSFHAYVWSWVEGKQIVNNWSNVNDIPSQTVLSTAFSKDLKKRGFQFVGRTTIYSFMQAVGLINDHISDCFCKNEDNNV